MATTMITGIMPHDVNRHDERIRAFCLTSDEPIRQGALDMFLDLLRSSQGAKLLRVKGLVALAEDPDHPVVIHGVQHVVHVPAILANGRATTGAAASSSSSTTWIGASSIGSGTHFLADPRIDQPDAAALSDNPLSLRR